jgi:hypothetical protein
VALLEVVLALAVFFGVAITILGGLGVCMKNAREVRLDAQAADLAVTLLSEIEMGVYEVANAGPTAFEEPNVQWTWQISTTAAETTLPGTELTQVEIIIHNTNDDYTYRLYQLLPAAEDAMTTLQTVQAPASGGQQ